MPMSLFNLHHNPIKISSKMALFASCAGTPVAISIPVTEEENSIGEGTWQYLWVMLKRCMHYSCSHFIGKN